MSTSAQIAANSANSQLSTGPKTETGKAAAARNNIRHGLASASAFRVLPTESQFAFDELLAGFRDEHRPATPTEETLVQAMAEHRGSANALSRSKHSVSTPSPARSPTPNGSLSTSAIKLPTSALFTNPSTTC